MTPRLTKEFHYLRTADSYTPQPPPQEKLPVPQLVCSPDPWDENLETIFLDFFSWQ